MRWEDKMQRITDEFGDVLQLLSIYDRIIVRLREAQGVLAERRCVKDGRLQIFPKGNPMIAQKIVQKILEEDSDRRTTPIEGPVMGKYGRRARYPNEHSPE